MTDKLEDTPCGVFGGLYWVAEDTTDNTDWFAADNWCPKVVPKETSDVYLPSGAPAYPVKSSPRLSAVKKAASS